MKKVLILTIEMFLMLTSYLQAQQNDSLHKIKKDGKWGYANNKGNEIVPFQYMAIGELGEEGFPVRAQKITKRWTYVDRNGKEITGNDSYEYAYPFYESDLALVGSEGKFGYINKQGQVKIPFQYKKAYPFSDEVAAVKKEDSNKFGFINCTGKEIIEPSYSDVKWGFIMGRAWVKEGKNWGMINKKGDKISGFNYSRLSYFDPSTGAADAVTRKGDTHYYYKGKFYSSKKGRDEALNPIIIWPEIPETTKEQLFAMNAEIKSDSRIGSCIVLLNDEETFDINASGGSALAKDLKKKDDYQYSQWVNRTLTLKEGDNTIAIEVQNAKGEVVKMEQKHITYNVKPNLASIVWNDVPSMTEQKLFLIRAKIQSESKIEYYRILQNDIEIRNSKVNIESKGNRFTKGGFIPGDTLHVINESIELLDGENTIVIEVKNEAEGFSRKEQKIFYKHIEKRLALVIGNWDYQTRGFDKLICPENDADSIYRLLETSGYDMMPQSGPLINANKERMEKAIDDFVLRIGKEEYDAALFYFSGHGISPQEEDDVYLIPTEASINCVLEAPIEAVSVKKELISPKVFLDDCHAYMVFLDCCRDCEIFKKCSGEGESKGGGGYTGGLSIIDFLDDKNIAIVYATQDGKTAIDGKAGENSPFVEGIMHCAKKDESWSMFVDRLRSYVFIKTNKIQKPNPVGGFITAPDFKPFSFNNNN